MVGIQDSFNHIHVAVPDISEPDGQEEGPLPLCLRWLERCVCVRLGTTQMACWSSVLLCHPELQSEEVWGWPSRDD